MFNTSSSAENKESSHSAAPSHLRRVETLLQAIMSPVNTDDSDDILAGAPLPVQSSFDPQQKLLDDIREFISGFDNNDVETKDESRYSQIADSSVPLAKRGRYEMMGAMPPMIELCRMMGLTRCH